MRLYTMNHLTFSVLLKVRNKSWAQCFVIIYLHVSRSDGTHDTNQVGLVYYNKNSILGPSVQQGYRHAWLG